MDKGNKKILTRALFCVIFFLAFCSAPLFVSAATNISSSVTQHWAWNDAIGWINFYMGGTSNIVVSASQLTYSASSSLGLISLDCGTAPGWNCGTSNYKVTNDGVGNLGGWAWNDAIGWVSFYWGDATADYHATSTYNSACTGYGGLYCGVQVLSDGSFRGFAWNDTIGWISFNCLDQSGGVNFCNNVSNYDVASSWAPTAAVGTLDSATFDTSSTGAELNSLIWQGSLNGLLSTAVGFQFAASTSTSGPWKFTGPAGTTSTSDIYYGAGPNTPIPIYNYPAYVGNRYFRYRIILQTNTTQSVSPEVTGVSVDWSP
ncbi:MAG: hypothetical protein WCF77_01375 [Minisyncoccia bacterium]